MLPTGELLVFSVTSSDAQSSYRCRTVHRVTGDTVESSSYARLVVTGKFYTMIYTHTHTHTHTYLIALLLIVCPSDVELSAR